MAWYLREAKGFYMVILFTVLVSQGGSIQQRMQPNICPNDLDLIVAIDSSGSVQPFWNDAIDYTEVFLSKFDVADNMVRVGLIDFSAVANAISPVDTGNNLGILYQLLEELRRRPQNGETNTNLALERALEMFRGSSRKQFIILPRVLVILTDGELTSGKYTELEPVLKDLKDFDVITFVVAVGNDTVLTGLEKIASKPSYQYKFDMVPSSTVGFYATQSLASAVCFAKEPRNKPAIQAQTQQKPSEVKGEETQSQTQTPQSNQVQPQQFQQQAKPEAQPESQPQPQPQIQPQTQSQQQSETQPQTKPQIPQLQTQPQAQVNPKPQTQAQPQYPPQHDTQIQPQPQIQPQQQIQPQTQIQPPLQPLVSPVPVKQEEKAAEPSIEKEEQKAPTGQTIQPQQKRPEQTTDITNEQKLQEYLNGQKPKQSQGQVQQQQQQSQQKVEEKEPQQQLSQQQQQQKPMKQIVSDSVQEIGGNKPEIHQESVQQIQAPTGLQSNAGAITSTPSEVPKCNINVTSIGCFRDTKIAPRPFPVLILEDSNVVKNAKDRKPFENSEDWNKFFIDFICKCANAAREKSYWSFGIQNYAECYSGPDEGRYDEDGGADAGECITNDYKPCLATSEKCAGKEHANFVYSVFTPTHKAIQRIEYEKRSVKM